MHADRTNRAALTLLGLLLLLAGAGGVLAHFGVLSASFKHRALFDNNVSAWIGANGKWLWPVVAVAGLILLILVLRWITTLLISTDRSGDLPVPAATGQGRTRLRDGAVTTAVTTEIEAYRGVDSARARLIGDGADPHLVLGVTALADTDIARLRTRIETEALAHVRTALDRPDLPAQLDLAVSNRTAQRVR